MSYAEEFARVYSARPQKLEAEPPLRLFVGGLNKSTSEEVLFQYFSQFGELRAIEIAKSSNAVSKGFGFVTFANRSLLCDELLHETHCLEGRSLRVELALALTDRFAAHESYLARRLYLSGIPSTATQEDIYEALARFGTPESITSLRRSNPYSNPNSFYCYVTMDRPQAARKILESKLLRCRAGFHALVHPCLIARTKKQTGIHQSEAKNFKLTELTFGQRRDPNFSKTRLVFCIPQASWPAKITVGTNEPRNCPSDYSLGDKVVPRGPNQGAMCCRNLALIRLPTSHDSSAQSRGRLETRIRPTSRDRKSVQEATHNLRFNLASWRGLRPRQHQPRVLQQRSIS